MSCIATDRKHLYIFFTYNFLSFLFIDKKIRKEIILLAITLKLCELVERRVEDYRKREETTRKGEDGSNYPFLFWL